MRKNFGFLRKRTEIFDRAFGTLWFFRETNTSAMILHQMAETDALFLGNDCHQVGFDFVRVGFFCEAKTLRETHDVGVDADRLLAEGVTEDDVRRLASDAGQRHEIF